MKKITRTPKTGLKLYLGRILSLTLLIFFAPWLVMSGMAEESANGTMTEESVSESMPEGSSDSWVPNFFANDGDAYLGGRGLITNQGPTGMFLNPTSGTMPKGQFTAQFFATSVQFAPSTDQNAWYNAMGSYGITDWLELGAILQLLRLDNNGSRLSIMSGGPFARIRVLKDEGFWPELSFAGILLPGNDLLQKGTLLVAAYKRLVINEDFFIPAVRFHVGGRQFWQESPNPTPDSVAWLGGEVELPKDIYLVSEVQTKATGNINTPWSVGFQLRHGYGYGLSLSLLQFGFSNALTAYVGIGINFG